MSEEKKNQEQKEDQHKSEQANGEDTQIPQAEEELENKDEESQDEAFKEPKAEQVQPDTSVEKESSEEEVVKEEILETYVKSEKAEEEVPPEEKPQRVEEKKGGEDIDEIPPTDIRKDIFEVATAEEVMKILSENLNNYDQEIAQVLESEDVPIGKLESLIANEQKLASLAAERLINLNLVSSKNEKDRLDEINENLKITFEYYENTFSEVKKFSDNIQQYVNTLDIESEEFMSLDDKFKEKLTQRKKSIDIIGRMAGRLNMRYQDLSEIKKISDKTFDEDMGDLMPFEIPVLTERTDFNEMKEVLKQFSGESQDVVDSHYKRYGEIRDKAYYLERDIQGAVDKVKKMTFDFLKDQFLPVADGIDRGLEESKKTVESIGNVETLPEIVGKWLNVYKVLHNHLQSFGDEIGMERLVAEKGDTFDETTHFVVSTEPVPELEDETILETSRPGYKLSGELLRPIEVIAVKN